MTCARRELIHEYVLGTLSRTEALPIETHLADCTQCRRETEAMRATVDAFAWWPTDVLRPSTDLWGRLARRIAVEPGAAPWSEPSPGPEPEWAEAAPGIFCKVLATDAERDVVSMLVRLAPGVEYPPHTHAGSEELHLLHGELWIDDRKLHAGDFYRAEAGTRDRRVWSETGCTCVLTTSSKDQLD